MKPTHNMRVAHKKECRIWLLIPLCNQKTVFEVFHFFGLKKWSWIKIVNDTTQNMKVADKKHIKLDFLFFCQCKLWKSFNFWHAQQNWRNHEFYVLEAKYFCKLKNFNNYTWIFLRDQNVQKHDVFSKKNAETTCMYYNFWELKNSKKMNLVFHNVQNSQKDELISILLEQKKAQITWNDFQSQRYNMIFFFCKLKPWTSYMKQNLSQ